MDTATIPEPCELPNKPLVEAIFELRWALTHREQLPLHDPGFRIALGRYYDRVRTEYPLILDLPTSQIPEEMTAYAVRHQFRADNQKWPLTQLGPGILTVNDTENYTWSSFRPRLLSAINAIFESYPVDIAPFSPTQIQLRYIDAIPYNPDHVDPIRFLSQSLHTSISIEPLLFDDPDNPDAPLQTKLTSTFALKKPRGFGTLGFATVTREGQPNIILEITIRTEGNDVPKHPGLFETWLDDAHSVVDRWFFTLCRGNLLESFKKKETNTNA